MKDVDKSKQQLIREVEELRKEINRRRRAEKALPQSEERFQLAVRGSKLLSRTHYQTLFNASPVPLWEEDFSELYAYLEELKEKGVRDFRAYFDKNPAELSICAQKVEILDVNQATLELHHAKNKENYSIIWIKYSLKNLLMFLKKHSLLLLQGSWNLSQRQR